MNWKRAGSNWLECLPVSSNFFPEVECQISLNGGAFVGISCKILPRLAHFRIDAECKNKSEYAKRSSKE